MTIAAYLAALRWVDEPVIAAGRLRQGGPFLAALRPRHCRLLPRQFVLALTPTRAVAFEAWGTGDAIGIRPGIRAAFSRDEVELTDLRTGSATMRIRDERFPVSRPSGGGDPDTDELIALLGGLPPLKAPQEPAWAAFSL
jgi:hypothetical protein